MHPNIKLSLLAPQKDQASRIAKANIEAIWGFLPLLKKEIKKEEFTKDYTRILFWNNSELDILPVAQGTRGLRRHGLSFEEIVEMDRHRETIGEVILPLLANNRRSLAKDGKPFDFEVHKQTNYITTASSRQSYAWEEHYSVMMEMAVGKSAFVIGNDFHLPVMVDQLDPDYIEEVRGSPSMSPMQFAREYMSIWTGSSDNSLVQLEDLESCQVLTEAEFKAKRGDHKYIISVDVARSERRRTATTAIAVFKLIPRGNGTYIKHLVNVHTYKGPMHFKDQSIYIKELVEKFDASMVVIDGNGLGRGLIDYLVKEDKYPSYYVVNDDTYNKYRMPNSLPLIFNMMSNTKETSASKINNNFMTSIANHDLKLLVSEREIKEKINEKNHEEMTEKILPYIETKLFIDEVMNLSYEARGNNTVVKQISGQMDKDRFSAVSYGLYYIYLKERKNQSKNRGSIDISDFFAVKKANYKIWN